MALVRYALTEVLRGRHRTAAAVIGVALAISFLAGTSIAIDSSLRAALDSYLSRLQADFVVSAHTARPMDLADNLTAVRGVASVAVLRTFLLDSIEASGAPPFVGSLRSGPPVAIAADPARLPRSIANWQLAGTMGLALGSAVVSQDVASSLGLERGSTVELQSSAYNASSGREIRFTNLTVEGILSPPAGWEPPTFTFGLATTSFVLVPLRDSAWLEAQLAGRTTDFVTVEVYIDRASLNPYDIEASRRYIARLERDLQQAAAPYGGNVFGSVPLILDNVALAQGILRGLFLAFAGPIIVLGLYVGAIGVDLAHSERRRHLAILKTRGASPRQIVRLLLLEALVGGVLAAGLGLLVGAGISRVLVGSISTLFDWDVGAGEIAISWTTVLLTVLFATAFMFLVSYRSAKRTARSPVVETLRFHVPGETRVAYRPTTDLIFLAVGVGSVVLYLARRVGGGLFAFFVDPLPFVLLPFAPFLIAVGFIRLSTRASPKAYEWASRITKPFLKSLHYLVARNLGRNPRRASSIAVILALGLAFGIMSLSTLQGDIEWENLKVRATLGADLSVVPPAGDGGFMGNLSALRAVTGTTVVRTLAAAVPYSFRAEAFALDPGSYFEVTRPEPWFFVGSAGAETAREILSTRGQVLASQTYLDDAALQVGDPLRLSYSVYNETSQQTESRPVNVTIGGAVRGLPGTGPADYLPAALYGSAETFGLGASEVSGTTKVLVNLAEASDWRSAKQAILDLGATEVTAYEEARAVALSNPGARAFLGFMSLQSVFLIVVVVAGLVLVTFSASLERVVEFAGITARGASGWQTAAILLGEALSIVVIGGSVGAVAGVLGAYIFSTVVPAGPGGEAYAPFIPFPFVVPPEAVLFGAGAAGALLLAALLVSWRVARMDVARVLKLRSG